ncbi:MAG: ABC transporter ATP-binding protein [Ardenticatenaceae bacterium]
MKKAIEVRNLVKRYKSADSNAVDGISFDVEAGQLFALLGPNGAGKTTTISILNTTLAPTDGMAKIAGYNVNTQSAEVRQQIGVIFQNPSLDMNLTAEENVRFHAILYGLYSFRPLYRLMPKAYREKVEQLAHILGIEKDIFKPIKTFSGGMKRKLEILRSLLHEPQVLILDEPTVGLDPASRRNLWQYIQQVRKDSGTTVLLTTHYLDEAEGADTICIMNQGQIVSYGTTSQIKSDLVEQYLLIDADDRDALRTELTTKAIPFTKTEDEDRPLKINAQPHEIHQLMRRIDTPLTSVETHLPTLEDAYLAITSEVTA